MTKKNNYGAVNRRVFIIYATSLLAAGVQMILKEHGLEAIEVNMKEGKTPHFINSLEFGDIVIMDSDDVEVRPCLSALQPLVQSSNLVLICLNPGESSMEIYRKEKRTLGKLQDLFEVIRYA